MPKKPRSPEGVTWIRYDPRMLRFTRKTAPPLEEWTQVVLGMDVELESSNFWRADIMLIGLVWYGTDVATGVIDDQHGTAKTWANNLSIGKRLPPDGINEDLELDPDYKSRRHPSLTYSHHAEVAYMESYLEVYLERDPTREEIHEYQAKYLNLAADRGLSVSRLRKKIRHDLLGEGEDPLGDEVAFQKGSIIQRLERVDTTLDNLLGDLPEDWEEEQRLVENAKRFVRDAAVSARNRQVGEPQPSPEAEVEVDAEAEPVPF